jgi:hypothetical protein
VPALLPELSSHSPSSLIEDERWQATLRIVNSARFSKSSRLSQLLLYLAKQTLLERTALLNEQNIAVEVFERGEGFNPSVDTIVRSHMVRLRQRLEQYALDFPNDQFRVTVPKGEYIVRFERTVPSAAHMARNRLVSPLVTELPTTAERSSRTKGITNPLLIPCCLMGLIIAGLSFVLWAAHHHLQRSISPPTHPLWSRIFQSSRPTTFVAADNGLVLLHWMTKKDTTLADHLDHNFNQELQGLPRDRADEIRNIANRRYTSFVDLNLFRRIQQLPSASTDRLILRYARDLGVDELKQGNIVLSGARGANPWVELYEPQMNFYGSDDGPHHIYSFINRQPKAGEPDRYFASASDPKHHVLGVVAFISNLDRNGNALIVEGNSMAGTEAITDFLFNDEVLLPFLNHLKRSDGSLPHFEVLVESNSVNGNAGSFHILSYRTHP